MEVAAGAWYPKGWCRIPGSAKPHRGGDPVALGTPPPPPSSSPGTVGFRLRLPKGVTEVSIPFAKAGGRGRVIVWRGGDPSGAALC